MGSLWRTAGPPDDVFEAQGVKKLRCVCHRETDLSNFQTLCNGRLRDWEKSQSSQQARFAMDPFGGEMFPSSDGQWQQQMLGPFAAVFGGMTSLAGLMAGRLPRILEASRSDWVGEQLQQQQHGGEAGSSSQAADLDGWMHSSSQRPSPRSHGYNQSHLSSSSRSTSPFAKNQLPGAKNLPSTSSLSSASSPNMPFDPAAAFSLANPALHLSAAHLCSPIFLFSSRSLPATLSALSRVFRVSSSPLIGWLALSSLASLSLAFAATAAERLRLAEGEESGNTSSSSSSDVQSKFRPGEAVEDPFSQSEWQPSSLDSMLGPEEGELSSACLSVSRSGLGLANSEVGVAVEPNTKVRFPLLLCADGTGEQEGGGDESKEPCQLLAGIGVRSRTIALIKSIRVYAFGLYVRPDKLRSELAEKYGGLHPDDIKLREEFYDDLLSRELGMTVRLVVHYRGLKMSMVKDAFNTSLSNRLRKQTGTAEHEGLEQFLGFLSKPRDISRGTTISFSWQPGGKLVTEVDGEQMGTIVSPPLCRAMFDLYIGDPPVSMKTKREIGESVARMIHSC